MKNVEFFKKFIHNFAPIIVPILIFLGTFLLYKNIYPEPRNWYDHYLYLGRAIMGGRVDVADLPSFYHDKIEFEGRIYLPFPPMAAIVMIPFLYFSENVTQQQISILFGALNALLIFILVRKFTNPTNSTILAFLFAFGTSAFWTSLVGTTWFFAHTVGVSFLLMSLIFHFEKKDFLAGIFLAVAGFTRLPLILAGSFFLFMLYNQKRRILLTIFGSLIFLPAFIFYNWARFESVLETGYTQVYNQYVTGSYPYTIMQIADSSSGYYSYMDLRNIPLHLYTLFLLPPTIEVVDGIVKNIKPSPFGMGILFTTPILFIALKPPFKSRLEKALLGASVISALPTLLHYMQGWVQFGYRFILDYIVFLMILLAIRFKLNKLNLTLVIVSLLVNFWGVLWAIQLGW